MGSEPTYYKLFKLTENGFLFISALIGIVIVLGLIAAFTVFRHRLTGKKLMFLGGQFIVLGVISNKIIDFSIRFPSAAFICILLGIIITFIGLFYED
ncbi:hypothetical protein GZH47_25655 [Paenibacillus rhizovicinus]|uniref:Uncharacterized protein n=1 Tax=Paenibacillus rhizovicinus TaxID=2704463 RepID=A0A6C0P5R9_9BACL|nr:hypothetical protein [Paenibacillus rhizovicinus]QHW33847.1 hypothetical protein GZH47_25655 [Paenibacillus rhizovicinus]